MIINLDNLISLFTIPMGYILEDLVLSLRTPTGFLASFSTILFVEGVTLKSIIEDSKKIKQKIKIGITKKVEEILTIKNQNKTFINKLPVHIISE